MGWVDKLKNEKMKKKKNYEEVYAYFVCGWCVILSLYTTGMKRGEKKKKEGRKGVDG